MSRERPILMNGDMVRAILDGSKTQTRRPLSRRLAAEVGFIGGAGEEHDPHAWGFGDIDGCWHVLGRDAEPWFGDGVTNGSYRIQCEIGEVGDTLWVRECCASPESITYYRATDAALLPPGSKWTPSIHMPRWASRLTLRVTEVRVERVQDISERDACADGGYSTVTRDCKAPKFAALWNEVYGTWDANPWVWAISFEVVP